MAADEPTPQPEPARRRATARRRIAQRCQVCGNTYSAHDLLPAALVRDDICHGCLNRCRGEYIRAEMEKNRGELSALEEEVMHSLHGGALVADNLNAEFDSKLTLGERVSDRVSAFGGSWRFIILFFTVMIVWITANSVYLLFQPFDPFPYILLNLALSLLAAIQAPIILMSQNRQEARDELRAENDYQVNLKAELEVRAVSEKLDLLLHHQWAHLLEIQRVQTEMIEDMVGRREQ